MKLTTTTMVTVDGVMQGLGAADEDRRGGFERGGWVAPLFDTQAGTLLNQIYGRADAMPDPGGNPIWTALHTRPKYLASTTLTNPKWPDTTVLSGDLTAAIAELTATPGGELQVHGSGALIRWLLEHQLVEELTLLVCPVILGQGRRLFPDRGPDTALDLVASQSTAKGVTIQVYRPTGRPQYATATAD
jgi:dihydrofolate reductase